MAQEAGQSRNALLDFRLTDCIGEAYVRICPMTAEVDAGRNRNARAFEYIAAKSFTVGAKSRAVGIDEESAIRCLKRVVLLDSRYQLPQTQQDTERLTRLLRQRRPNA